MMKVRGFCSPTGMLGNILSKKRLSVFSLGVLGLLSSGVQGEVIDQPSQDIFENVSGTPLSSNSLENCRRKTKISCLDVPADLSLPPSLKELIEATQLKDGSPLELPLLSLQNSLSKLEKFLSCQGR